MKPKIIMHVNYCEQGQTIPEICQKAVDWGFDGVEFRRKRFEIEEGTEEYLDRLSKAVLKSKLECVLFGAPGPDLMATDAAEREKEIESAEKFFRLAAGRFKLSVCNTMTGSLLNPDKNIPYDKYELHGSQIATAEQWAWAVSGFKTLGALAVKLGFRLAFETHMCYLHDLPLATKKLVDLIDSPAVGVNLDYGNAIRFPNIPPLKKTIEDMSDKLYYVHLKNSVAGSRGTYFYSSLEEGEINNREFLITMKERGYKGPICIEAPRPGDREYFAQQDLKYLSSVLREINWK